MEQQENKIPNLPQKSHEVLIKFLNNIGIIGAVLAGVAELIVVIIFIVGIKLDVDLKATLIFAIINALIGILINTLLRYQGQKYAEIENEETCKKYYAKKIKEEKHYISMNMWSALAVIKDVIFKGATTTFSIFGMIYLSIEGSKNPVQLLLTLVTLIMFACFGLINMNSSYCRFYNKQLPYMENKIKEKEIL